MIYVLDDYFAIDHEDFCLVLESNYSTNEMIELCSAITFLLQDITYPGSNLSMECLCKVLTNYFEMLDIKDIVTIESLKALQLPICDISESVSISVGTAMRTATIIDLYEAWDSCCGPDYKELYKKYFPSDSVLEEIKQILIEEGIEE